MSDYDRQYQTEQALFGVPYAEFEAFVAQHAPQGGRALDLGCGQGRDSLMLARHGYTVTGVDSSRVGIEQMVARANAQGLAVSGVVDDLFSYRPEQPVDAIVLDSILHFAKMDKVKELALLDALPNQLKPDGFLFLFVHKSKQKEAVLKQWLAGVDKLFEVAEQGYIDYVYRETVSGFESAFQYYMLILQRTNRS